MNTDLEDALQYLEDHANYETMTATEADITRLPTLDRISRMVDLMGNPQHHYPVIHITGTNGKTSTATIITELLMAKGLSVGTYTSPHFEEINERLRWNGSPISDEELVELLDSLATLEPLMGDQRLTYFEVLTAAAFRWFSDLPVDIAVVEVGLGGQWDATNVADADVAVVTNVGLDHMEFLGDTRQEIAQEKSGIIKSGSQLVLGEEDPEIAKIFLDTKPESACVSGTDFFVTENRVAHGGRVVDIETAKASYNELFVPLHGGHQAHNVACALVAVESFFGEALNDDLVNQGVSATKVPGRLEVIGRDPLCILDGAHNPHGMSALRAALNEEFATIERRIVVMGLLRGRDPGEMLRSLGPERIHTLVVCTPPSPRALPADDLIRAADEMGISTRSSSSVPDALALALGLASDQEMVLVTGSLYAVGAARKALRNGVG